jgi:hypothetical protein
MTDESVLSQDVVVTNLPNEPRVSWRGLPYGKVFYDRDGSTWMIQKDLETGKLFPALIQGAPRPQKLPTGHPPKKF